MSRYRTFSAAILAVCLGIAILPGCHGAEEAEQNERATPNATAVMERQMNDVKAENSSLKQQVEKLQQDNRTLTARIAELETQMSEPKEKAPVETHETKPAMSDAHSTYEEGLTLYHQGQYDKALANFNAVADGGSDLSDRGAYWAGECHYAQKDFRSAIESFQKVLGYSSSTKKDDAQVMIGNSYVALGQKSKAKSAYETLIKKYPASPFVKRAKAKLRSL